MATSAAATTVVSPRSAVTPLRLRREPRPEEVALLGELAFGPAPVTEGPVGRCSKRGWCRAVSNDTDASALFELTPAGAEILRVASPRCRASAMRDGTCDDRLLDPP